MSEQPANLPTIDLQSIISYPSQAKPGKSYLMSIDVQFDSPETSWPYTEEEYPIFLLLDTYPYFSHEPWDDCPPVLLLHRFGGTYGPAQFQLTATHEATEPGHIYITFMSEGGLILGHVELPCAITDQAPNTPTTTVQREVTDSLATPTPPITPVITSSEQTTHEPGTSIRKMVEEKLIAAGWVIQDATGTALETVSGIAVRGIFKRDEILLSPNDVDYLLIVNNTAAGAVLLSVQEQPISNQTELLLQPSELRSQLRPIRFYYETNGHVIQFTNSLEPDARTRRVFHFHRPETLVLWLSQAPVGTPNELNDLLRSRLRRMPSLKDENIANQEAFQALTELEKSLAANRPRALVQMPRGIGNTIALAYMAYRLIYHAHAQRVLFLVVSDEYAQTAYNCFEKIRLVGQEKSFVEQYRVQILRNIKIDSPARVVISTVVQLYMALIKEKNLLIFDEAHRSPQGFSERYLLPLTEVPYNNALSLECFDAIMINNCSAEVYRDWRLLLEYFDAFIIGATNSVDQQIRGFYNGNLVYNYSKGNTPFAIAERLWKHYSDLRGYGFTPEDYLEHLTYLLLIRASELFPSPILREANVQEDSWARLLGMYHSDLTRYYLDTLILFFKQRNLERIYPSDPRNKFQNPRLLADLIHLIDQEYQPEMGSEVLASIYEKLLEKCAESDNKRIGLYFTPHALSQSIVEVMQPEAWMRVCDPACGAGEFLVEAYKYAANQEKSQQIHENFASGWEENENISKIGTMNLFIHGIAKEADFSPIRLGDGLSGMHISALFDMVFCHPPFGKKYNIHYEGSRFGWGIPTENTELAYIQLAYALLDVGGRASVIAPNGVLFRKGAAEDIRRALLATCDFHTLLLLPENIFYSTGTSGVVLFFNKQPSSENPDTRELWIYDLRTDLHFTRRNPLRRKDLDDFVRCYNPENRHSRRETARFRRFSYEELLAREDCNFNISWPIDEILTVDNANLDRRFSAWLATYQQTRPQPFTDEQILWLERIRNRISNTGSFTEQDFESTPFTFDGGLVAARHLFGSELPILLQGLNGLLSWEE